MAFLCQAIRFLEDHGGAITTLATVVIALFTGTLWWVTSKSISIAKESADAAKDSTNAYIAGERAYLVPGDVQLSPQSTPNILYGESLGVSAPVVICKIFNIGKTPAVLREIRTEIYLGSKLPDFPTYTYSQVYNTEDPIVNDTAWEWLPTEYPQKLTGDEVKNINNETIRISILDILSIETFSKSVTKRGFVS